MKINFQLLKFVVNLIIYIIKNFYYSFNNKIFLVTDNANWIINEICDVLSNKLTKIYGTPTKKTITPIALRHKIIHFNSLNTSLAKKSFKKQHLFNKIVVTFFHIVPDDFEIKNIKQVDAIIDKFHTSCNFTKNDLINLGINPDKITVIPLGIDLEKFKPRPNQNELKQELDIPKDKVVIGSFQKDGVGWGVGNEPKLIKGPDIFVKAVEEIDKKYPVFVLLVGPSRGYVINELTKRHIPFKSIGYLKKSNSVAKYYNALDLYLITSRIEGGPSAFLESWASGVPVVSTRVGLVPDIGKDNETVLLCDVENFKQIAEKAQSIIKNEKIRTNLINNSLKEVKKYSWHQIVQRYYQEIYQPLLKKK